MEKTFEFTLKSAGGDFMTWEETGQGFFDASQKTMELVLSAYPQMGWEIVKVEKIEK